MKKNFQALISLKQENKQKLLDLGLLFLRLVFGGLMLYGHAFKKLVNFQSLSTKFPDPLGIGSSLSLSLAFFAEFFCSIAIILGFATRLSSLPLAFTMIIAAFVHHGADPFKVKEKAILYLAGYLILFLTGAGKYSLDTKFFGKKEKKA